MWGVEVWLHAFLILALDGEEWSFSRNAPRKRALDTEWIYVGPRASLDTV
jgi:hypothetical protein